MPDSTGTPFSDIYDKFLDHITDDMYMELTEQETFNMMEKLLKNAVHWFEFPRVSLQTKKETIVDPDSGESKDIWSFSNSLSEEQQNIIAVYMVVEWIGQQLASVEVTRQKYAGTDFKMTSQANHGNQLSKMKKQYISEGFHLQRLYKRRKKDANGIPRSTFGQIMQ